MRRLEDKDAWEPIDDLPAEWQELRREDLHLVHKQWRTEKSVLKDPQKILRLQERLTTEWAIETGIIERLYTVDRGVTESLIDLGFEAIHQIHEKGQISRDALKLIEDQKETIDFVFDFIKQQRTLTTSYIKELHQLLTRHQGTSEAVDQFGKKMQVELHKGEWKRLPNNPTMPDGRVHEYCPPDFVQDEMDQLLRWHHEHRAAGVDAEVESAWLHHRFAQIHPVQDGNGRIARALATLVFLQDDYLPLVIRDVEHRDRYLDALLSADFGNLESLVNLFADIQLQDLTNAIQFLRQLRGEGVSKIAASAAERIKLRQKVTEDDARELTEELVRIAVTRLNEVESELELEFSNQGVRLQTLVADNTPAAETWWNRQIVEMAQHYGYWADLSRFRRWLRLRLRLPDLGETQANIVVSFHHKGTAAGLMVASCFLSTSTGSDGEREESQAEWEVVPATKSPFTYSASHRDPIPAFRVWLDEAVESALDRWQTTI